MLLASLVVENRERAAGVLDVLGVVRPGPIAVSEKRNDCSGLTRVAHCPGTPLGIEHLFAK